ncbi:DEAD/DEAH box helicase [Treponema sp. TIM-1]|uniref:DEAD/DEAH box helicase n=1 Tax=Treponema sp. TIM-1 TaxID=2898417 RepID=UPI00397F75A7
MLPQLFHPIIQTWFAEIYGKPTAVQQETWPRIVRGEHVLALAPTGSGKTLTAFLVVIDRFIRGIYPPEGLSVLYVSPLKALNEDIRRNLLEPIAALRSCFEAQGIPFPELRVETRSGDTPQGERRRFLKAPPVILAVTPESLAIMLLNPRSRVILSGVKYLILDEIHAVLGTKRGSFLFCQVDRLALIAGEFQRVSLSATIHPPQGAAELVGGLKALDGGYEKRQVSIVAPPMEKHIDLVIDFPSDQGEFRKPDRYGKRYTVLVNTILERIAVNHGAGGGATLVFTDSRRRAERIAFLLNEAAEETLAFTHHGSLSREVRREVEAGLSSGRLPCVVATSSLELGIDIGRIAEVILAGSPASSTGALQRIGRSGHGVGLVSRGRLLPFHGLDLLTAAALGAAIQDKEIEETRAIENPLDILAQIMLALCVEKNRNIDELYHTLRGFYVFKTLSRSAYDRVIRMLLGRYEALRLRDLKPRLYLDGETGELCPLKGTKLLLYASGGVITNRGAYSLRTPEGTKIGELDEEFVWERRIGDCFDFGNRSWRILSIGPEAVEVSPLPAGADFTPFWKAEAAFRSPVLVRRILENFDRLNSDNRDYFTGLGLSDSAFRELMDFISSERSTQGDLPLPGSGFIPVEIVDDPVNRGDSYQVILHSFRGGMVNYPLALALAEELEDALHTRIETFPDDNAVLLLLPRSIAGTPEELLIRHLKTLGEYQGDKLRGEGQFYRRFESSGLFGASFREAAERSLLLPRAGFGKRTPLWVMRQRAKRLFDEVSSYGDFPMVAEAWRSCLGDQFDLTGFTGLLRDIREGKTAISFFRTQKPSPFARDLVWKETNTLLYEYDEQRELRKGGPSLSGLVIEEALENARSRPPLSPRVTADFCARLRREFPGWAPEDERGLTEWVKERIAIPQDEWEDLLRVLPEEFRKRCREDPTLGGKIGFVRREGGAFPAVVHREWALSWKQDAPVLLGPWLRYEGPLSLSRIGAFFGLSPAEMEGAVAALAEEGWLVRDVTLGEEPGYVCDRENLDFLLRLSRKQARREVKERPAVLLIPYLARRQGILPRGSSRGIAPWEALWGYTAPAVLWERDILPIRDPDYSGETLDGKIRAGELLWYGTGKERTAFCPPEDMDLAGGEKLGAIPPFEGRGDPTFFNSPKDFWEIKEALGMDNPSCAAAIWEEVWKGRLSADSWEPVRRGLVRGFVPREKEALPIRPPGRPKRLPRALRDRWRAGPPVPGRWFSLEPDYGEDLANDKLGGFDPLEMEELERDRVRLLLKRWGILCRPLLERELPHLSWARLLPAIRRLELAGEVMAGRFFEGINSLQFASPEIPGELEETEGETSIYWMNAADPASPAGLSLEGLDPRLPPRQQNTRLCFRGSQLLVVAGRGAKDIDLFISPEDPDLGDALAFLTFPGTRAVHPERKITIETVNHRPAASGAYAAALKSLGFLPDRGKLILWL